MLDLASLSRHRASHRLVGRAGAAAGDGGAKWQRGRAQLVGGADVQRLEVQPAYLVGPA